MDDIAIAAAVKGLLASSRLSGKRLADYFDRAIEPAYWAGLNPNLSIGIDWDEASLEDVPLDPASIADAGRMLERDGYFQAAPFLNAALVGRMRAGVEKLRSERWPVAFALVYDEFWAVFRAPSIVKLASGVLGGPYRHRNSWIWHIDKQQGARGWPPHTDSDKKVGLTIWVPIADATVDNGCIYAIPKSQMPPALPSEYGKLEGVTREQLTQLLQGVTALPANAGSILGWYQDVIHWSGTSRARGTPRISMSTLLVPRADGASSVEPPLPTFLQRLRMISHGISGYLPLEPLLEPFRELAERLDVYAKAKSAEARGPAR